jgi:hypothetical protein
LLGPVAEGVFGERVPLPLPPGELPLEPEPPTE